MSKINYKAMLLNANSDREFNRIMYEWGNAKNPQEYYLPDDRAGFINGEKNMEKEILIGPTMEQIDEILKQCERKFGV